MAGARRRDGPDGVDRSAVARFSKAALHGGTHDLESIFVQCVARAHRPGIDRAGRQAHWKAACYCDYGFHLTLMGEVADRRISASSPTPCRTAMPA